MTQATSGTGKTQSYKRKLIEVSIPLDDINREAARENYIYRGNPSALQKWWAQRPFAAARAVLFAQLVDDPSTHPDLYPTPEDQQAQREKLFDVIRDLVKWENSHNEVVLTKARKLIRESCDGTPPPVLDPFAGGGTIPMEAQRLGLEAHASDLNPVAVLINKALIEIPPRWADMPPVHPQAEIRTGWRGPAGLAEDVRQYGIWIREQAEMRIGHLYPQAKLSDGSLSNVVAWIWARTVTCPNPACGGQMPLARSFVLSKKKSKERHAHPVSDGQRVRFEIRGPDSSPRPGTVGRSGAECLLCTSPVPLTYIRAEGKAGRMGTQLVAIAAEGQRQRHYLPPTGEHETAADIPSPDDIPDAEMPKQALGFRVQNYGMTQWSDLFTNRQLTALTTFSDLITEARAKVANDAVEAGLPAADAEAYANTIAIYLTFVVTKLADYNCTGAVWYPQEDRPKNLFALQAIPMVWDFPEINVFATLGGSWSGCLKVVTDAMEGLPGRGIAGTVTQANAMTRHIDTGTLISTDPPYYDNVPYADLSDFFYVWLRRSLSKFVPEVAGTLLTPKADELVADPFRWGGKDSANTFFEEGFARVFANVQQSAPDGYPITVFYAFKQSETGDGGEASTGWETLLEGMIRSGWMVTATWPIRTERSGRRRDIGSNALASSVVLACRARKITAPTTDRRGFLNELRAQLPTALRKLQQGNIAPVDLAQAAIGPGMEVFSKNRQVTEPDGSPMRVRTALQLINQVLDEVVAEQEGDIDTDSRWCVKWFEEHEWSQGEYGRAETLATALNTSISGLDRANVLKARAGKVFLLKPADLSDDYDPATDLRPTMWEGVLHLSKRLEERGIDAAGRLMARLERVVDLDAVKELAYLLYNICERKRRQDSALLFNSLVTSWPDIAAAARSAPVTDEQPQLMLTYDDE